MGAMTNFLVKDDATSPSEQSLVPVSDNPDPFWRSSIAGVPIAGQIRLTLMQEKLKSGGFRLSAKIEVPVMETLGASGTSAGYVAPPKVAYTTTAIFTMFADARSTTADRANTMKMLIGLLQGASSTTATGVLNNTSAGDAWKTNSSPCVAHFVSLITPN